jgi:hypothetical protein
MGLDFAALGTGMDIRQALETLEDPLTGWDEELELIALIRARVEELEQRLNTARRSAWVAVPVEWHLVDVGDVIVGKDGALLQVIDRGDGTWLEISDGTGDRVIRAPGTNRDHPVPVLRRPTADALDILTRQLGAQVTK